MRDSLTKTKVVFGDNSITIDDICKIANQTSEATLNNNATVRANVRGSTAVTP